MKLLFLSVETPLYDRMIELSRGSKKFFDQAGGKNKSSNCYILKLLLNCNKDRELNYVANFQIKIMLREEDDDPHTSFCNCYMKLFDYLIFQHVGKKSS